MKDIGQNFREARESIGISKEEVVKDLNITVSQLENLEDGNICAFKDVFFLKELVKKYSKYLNIDEDEIMSLFDDFIFGYTSRIPVEDILEQTREINILEKKQNIDKMTSPYTKIQKKKPKKYIFIYIGGVLLLIVMIFLIVAYINSKSETISIYYKMQERS